jgi:hypothetical protein
MASKWFPSTSQLADPNSLQQVFQQVLTQHYALQEQVAKMTPNTSGAAAPTAASDTPAGTKLAGLYVSPVDTQTLADGATLKFDKKAGNFKFS